ncbi:ZIP family metal transporter [Lysinibacter cavernae]|uniref:ZIP family zinc transporter n=1 Tax=Lysinibacter cavernae TaxID=1640652 RepID=A0A7X5TSP5_9MICO|nr:ZIP family metal transporter [Lysinibacter cavernae]NIH53721.1 ZIP family zinc transporter [Lysinibacter cavernae]
MPLLFAALSGFLGGITLVIGAAVAWFVQIPRTVVAGVMAFGAGVLISALAYELVQEANDGGGLLPTIVGFVVGALLYVGADWMLSKRAANQAAGSETGHRHRGKSVSSRNVTHRRQSGSSDENSGKVIAMGALIDGIPESIVLGLSVTATGGLSLPIVLAIAISNVPESLSSTSELKSSGQSARYVFSLWSGIALISTAAAFLGYALLRNSPDELIAVITTVAAGGLLAMVCNTMIPEAFAEERRLTGLWATLGFLTAFSLHELG